MRIALLTNGIFPYILGGMQKHSYYLAKYLAKNKVYVDLYHTVKYDEALVKNLDGFSEEELKYINNICLEMDKPKKYPGHYIIESYNLSKKIYESFLQHADVDFVYAQGFSGWYYAKQKSKGIQLPPIGVNFHGLEMFQKSPSVRVKLEHYMFRVPVKRAAQFSDYTFSLGGKLTGILNNIVDDPIKVIVTPIGISETWLIDQNSKDIITNKVRKLVFLGRYERRKGIEELTSVLKKLMDSYDFEFHFIGPIPESKKISSGKVIYHGLIKEEAKIKQILHDADVLVTPSYSEGMPTVILEAMASGSAVIATDVGAVSEEVDSYNGWLISPGDEMSLEKTIVDAIKCPDHILTTKKIHSIDKIKEKFLWDDIAKKTLRQIQQIIEDRKDEKLE